MARNNSDAAVWFIPLPRTSWQVSVNIERTASGHPMWAPFPQAGGTFPPLRWWPASALVLVGAGLN